MIDMTAKTIEDLSEVIAEEKQALLEGNLEALGDLLERKEALAIRLADVNPPKDLAAPLQEGLRRNQALYDQTLAGLRNVAERITALNRLRQGMDTYDARGQITRISSDESERLERRA